MAASPARRAGGAAPGCSWPFGAPFEAGGFPDPPFDSCDPGRGSGVGPSPPGPPTWGVSARGLITAGSDGAGVKCSPCESADALSPLVSREPVFPPGAAFPGALAPGDTDAEPDEVDA